MLDFGFTLGFNIWWSGSLQSKCILEANLNHTARTLFDEVSFGQCKMARECSQSNMYTSSLVYSKIIVTAIIKGSRHHWELLD